MPAPSDARTARSGPPLPLRTLSGFMVAILALLIIALLSHRSLQARSGSAELVTHTHQVLEQLNGILSSLKDAETGQRGFLLTGEERYLEPYTGAKAALPGELKTLRSLTADNAKRRPEIDALERLGTEKMDELGETIALRRDGDVEGALALVRTDRGQTTMERIRQAVAEMGRDEQDLLATRQREWEQASRASSLITSAGSGVLLFLILAAAIVASRDYRARETETWLRTGQLGLGARLEGEQRLEHLGENALEFLAAYLNAEVGAVYVAAGDGRFRRIAGYALPSTAEAQVLRAGDGLLGQAAKENRPLHVKNVPPDYLPIASALGSGPPRELLVAPASVDRTVQAVIELGFFRAVAEADQELLARASESLGVAVRSSKDRSRLEELLEETQRQSEELQTQQEELRVINEELEEQSHALKESQARLEAQQAELEQTNSQLEEQTQILEAQKDDLAHAYEALSENAAELERSNQYKSEFLANMSHELRTPLNSTLILAKILSDNRGGNLTQEQVKYAQTITSAGNDLLALINDILDISKIEAGKVEVDAQPVVVATTIDALAKTLHPLAEQKGLRFRVTVEPGTPERIHTDPHRLGQILSNLLSNAIKFTERGEVTLTASPGASGTIAFAVGDTGIGIPPHQQDTIFEAFRQADGSTHRRYGGTGLGLSISRDLARLLGGDIAITSAPDQGSVFTLTLPLAYVARGEHEPPRASAPVRTARPPAHVGERQPLTSAVRSGARDSPAVEDDRTRLTPDARLVLVVEDDPRFAAILQDLAHDLGFQCVIAHSASDALAAASTYGPSGVLLDINLPDRSGLGVLDELKRNPKTRHVPVHVVSVSEHAREALERGAIGYAVKPVKREQLVEAFQRLEAKLSQGLRRVLVVEEDESQRESIRQLLASEAVEITAVETADHALRQLQTVTFDCMVMDLNLPDLSGYELLEKMAEQDEVSFPPVIIYTGRVLTHDSEHRLRRFAKSIIIKDARSPERLLDEVTLFLHQVESELPPERQRMLQVARDRETALDGRRVLVVEDDVRNVFALSSLFEPKGVKVEIARNGREALNVLTRSMGHPASAVDLVLMDIMMPEMDGFAAMREIRKRPEWKTLPIIALTAKAMKDAQEKCLQAGANDYIAKPLDVEKLLSLVRIWMPK